MHNSGCPSHKINFSPLVTNEEPKYIILGDEVISKYPEIIIKLMIEKRILPRDYIREVKSVRHIKIKEAEEVAASLLKKYDDIFREQVDQTRVCQGAKHIIDTGDARPICCRTVRVPIHYESAIDAEIKKNTELGIIRASNSPWSSKIVPVSKPDGSLRMCIDYRPLNKCTIKDKYPIPRIDEILDALSGASIFSTLDATSGYYQLEVEEKDKKKTAFTWKGGHYEFNRMPFGLCNAPATFRRAMDNMLKEFNNVFVIPYLDDIIIYSKDIESHKQHVSQVFRKVEEAGLILNRRNTNFSRRGATVRTWFLTFSKNM